MASLLQTVNRDKSDGAVFLLLNCTSVGVCQSISQPVTRQWLMEVIENHRWKQGTKRSSEHFESQRLMPPPKINPRT